MKQSIFSKLPHEAVEFSNQTFEYRGLLFEPKVKRNKKTGGTAYRYTAVCGNLYIVLNPHNSRIEVKNSLHTFFHGHNGTDFPLSNFRDAVEQVSEIVGVNMLSAKVTQLEYGCNIITGDSSQFFQELREYRGKTYEPMTFGRTTYGKQCSFAQYRIKAYNKTKQLQGKINLDQEVARFEIKVEVNQYFKTLQVPYERVKDLLNYETAQAFAADIESKYMRSTKSIAVDYSKLTKADAKTFAAMQEEMYAAFSKEDNYQTYCRQQAVVRKILTNQTSQIARQHQRLLREKLAYLINR